ncbi:MAG TPA: PHB depolymerase family esterase [Propionibacteriaceae bacterium]|nr:PHB depolymerase family esterase [Propionibacteriaceae bacterium]
MSHVTRRGLFVGGAGVAAVALQPEIAHAAAPPTPSTVLFSLNATVLDGGEQVTSLTLDTSGFDPIDPDSLTTSTFGVHAKATSPVPVVPPDLIFSEYDVDRRVTAARLDHGKIVLDLETRDLATGGGTLGYVLSLGRNVLLSLTYTITQTSPLMLRSRTPLVLPGFTQGKLLDGEVDVYGHHKSADGMNYRLFLPEQGGGAERPVGRGKRPLIVWLHGGGEGGALASHYYDNESLLRANRGALGFSTPEAQRIFEGAYVLAPQSESYWLENGPAYAPRVRAIIVDLLHRYPIDPARVYVAGCSNGGYLTMEMSSLYPDLFAAAVPICGVVRNFPTPGVDVLTDEQLRGIRTPTWLVCAKSDTTVPPADNSEVAADLIPKSIFTEYERVTRNGITYPGHWSWVYVARNDPRYGRRHIWQWMASKKLSA